MVRCVLVLSRKAEREAVCVCACAVAGLQKGCVCALVLTGGVVQDVGATPVVCVREVHRTRARVRGGSSVWCVHGPEGGHGDRAMQAQHLPPVHEGVPAERFAARPDLAASTPWVLSLLPQSGGLLHAAAASAAACSEGAGGAGEGAVQARDCGANLSLWRQVHIQSRCSRTGQRSRTEWRAGKSGEGGWAEE
eukprot:542479-Rhodomonas_salina.1